MVPPQCYILRSILLSTTAFNNRIRHIWINLRHNQRAGKAK